ncbi:MAG: 2,4-diaminopentanoate dehydrogenase [Actinobacteria bacterium]|nr:2,4-diaminopentanoate dehydrogenase [Actinomycetota bacterium]
MSQPIRVVHWGLGAMGGGMARLALEKPGLRVVGTIDSDPRKAGRDLGEVLNLGRSTGVVVSSDPGAVLDSGADAAVIATGSFLDEVHPQINQAVDAGLNVICIAEEMAFPAASRPDLARAMDQAAKNRGATILGTGINPGFVLDTLIIALTGVCTEVSRIRAARINDLSPFGPTVMRTQGVGTTPEEFQRGLESGAIVGHIGFPESMHMIAAALGWKLDEIRQEREPIVSRTRRETPHVRVEPGMVAGCRHTAHGFRGGREVITLEHPQQIHPGVEGAETGDYIWIEGQPNLELSIRPEIPGGIGTIAIAVNMIPSVVKAEPGLVSMADLPIPRALLGEIRELAPTDSTGGGPG